MKTNRIFVTVIFLMSSILSVAQEKEDRDHLWTYQGKNKVHTLGLYGGIYTSYSEVMSKPAGYLGYKAGLVFDKKLGLGLSGFALWFDRPLDELTTHGTYRLEAGYNGVFVEYIQPLGNNVKMNFSLLSAAGLARYRVSKEFESDLPWYEEIIDQDNFAVLEPGIEVQARIGGNWWLGAYASYRTTSPLDMMGTDENLLENYTTGISVKLGVF